MKKIMPIPPVNKQTIISFSLGLLITGMVAVATGTWALASAVNGFSQRLTNLERSVDYRWSYPMAKDAWREAEKLNEGFKAPDLKGIRADNMQR